MREDNPNTLDKIYTWLFNNYGPQGWWPVTPVGSCRSDKSVTPVYGLAIKNERQRLEIIFGAVLTQNTAWINAEKAVVELNKQDLIDVDRILKISHSQLTGVIKSAGYYNEKAKKLKNIARFLKDCPIAELQRMELAEARELLLSVRGVGRETADSILLYALNKLIFVVDAYTRRVFSNLGFIRPDADYDEVQALFMDNLPHEARLFNEYHALIVRHAKTYYSKKPYGIRCPLRAFIAGL
ncbi:hypothetical protein AUJ69_03885 [Candidatus Woesearchaeota archaeon CG1_02_47_18]|nr:MAG: hypothetical protein AUJ69_03885 [Candidatus Woesearchaeota archaeon CG1_02_47_18]